MDLMQTIDLAAGGMAAQRTRINVVSTNLANANTTRTEDGTPYRKKMVIFNSIPMGESFKTQLQNAMGSQVYGVEVSEVVPVPGEFKKIFDPSHPDADPAGYVYLPNVNLVQEMADMLNANRAYEANAAVVKAAKQMALKAMEVLGR